MLTTGGLSTSTMIKAAAGVASLGFVGYFIYFDRKRRSDPNFKSKLFNKRLSEKKERERELERERERELERVLEWDEIPWPDLNDVQAVESFCARETRLANLCVARGHEDNAVKHLAVVATVSGHPHTVMAFFRNILSDHTFLMLRQKLPEYSEIIVRRLLQSQPAAGESKRMSLVAYSPDAP